MQFKERNINVTPLKVVLAKVKAHIYWDWVAHTLDDEDLTQIYRWEKCLTLLPEDPEDLSEELISGLSEGDKDENEVESRNVLGLITQAKDYNRTRIELAKQLKEPGIHTINQKFVRQR